MKRIVCIEIYVIEDGDRYRIRIKNPSSELTNKLLNEDIKIRDFLEDELIIEKIERKEIKDKKTYESETNENLLKVKRLIDHLYKNGKKEFTIRDIMKVIHISRGKIRYIMSILHKENYIEIINPHENPRKAKWKIVEPKNSKLKEKK